MRCALSCWSASCPAIGENKKKGEETVIRIQDRELERMLKEIIRKSSFDTIDQYFDFRIREDLKRIKQNNVLFNCRIWLFALLQWKEKFELWVGWGVIPRLNHTVCLQEITPTKSVNLLARFYVCIAPTLYRLLGLAWLAIEIPIEITLRVSTGSMIASTHRRLAA